MNRSTLIALLLSAMVLLLASFAFAGTLPPFPGTHSGIVSVSALPNTVHKA